MSTFSKVEASSTADLFSLFAWLTLHTAAGGSKAFALKLWAFIYCHRSLHCKGETSEQIGEPGCRRHFVKCKNGRTSVFHHSLVMFLQTKINVDVTQIISHRKGFQDSAQVQGPRSSSLLVQEKNISRPSLVSTNILPKPPCSSMFFSTAAHIRRVWKSLFTHLHPDKSL